jgi:hypothetical protein
MGKEKGARGSENLPEVRRASKKRHMDGLSCVCDYTQSGMGDQKEGLPGCSGICLSTAQKEWTGLTAGIVSDLFSCSVTFL